MADSSHNEICSRVRQVRVETAGPRGKSSFAKQLGISASTYDYYEGARVPPAEILVRISTVTGVDLRWLLTGQMSSGPGTVVGADHPVVQRAAAMLADTPKAAAPLAAFLDILAGSMAFPDSGAIERQAVSVVAPQPEPQTAPTEEPATPPSPEPTAAGEAPKPADGGASTAPTDDLKRQWIPVLGRSAAGVPHFWADGQSVEGITTLDELIDRHANGVARTQPAAATDSSGAPAEVKLITLTRPDGDLSEFVDCADLQSRYADAFALRIDGESMSPEILHGDLVVLSPRFAAEDGKAAVVQLAGQIGVTCKLFRREDNRVHLIPINEQLQPLAVEAAQVVWALRVLAKIRT